MRVRGLMAATVVVLLVSSGCDAAPADGGSAAPSRGVVSRSPVALPSDPAQMLAEAKARLGTESARFAKNSDNELTDYTGVVDALSKDWEVTARNWAVRRIGDDIYVRASGTILLSLPDEHFPADGWLHCRLPADVDTLATVYSDRFPWNMTNGAVSAKDVVKVGERSFTGMVDVVRQKDVGSPAHTEQVSLGFTLDDQGRFATIGDDFSFSDFGVPVTIVPPAPETVTEAADPVGVLLGVPFV